MPADEQNMRVIVRVRPQSELSCSTDNLLKEKELESNVDSGSNQAITVEKDQKQISVYRERKGHAAFSFSNVLDTTSTQETLYDLCKDSVGDVMSGVNCSILAYGQTGSGKTYSMLGKGIEEGATQGLACPRDLSATTGGGDDDNPSSAATHPQLTSEFIGIVPRCISDMFEWIDNKMKSNVSNNSSLDYSITANYLQIYNEKLFDLLQDRQLKNALQLRDAEKGAYSSVYVQGLSEYRVRSKDEVLSLLLKGLRNRATRATEMNNESSRSHTILQLFVQVHGFDGETGMPVLQRSTYSFVDLAGSEKWRSSLTQAGNSQLDVQKEMTNINTSLHALGNCVSALIEPGRKHIPYRDSLLTRLLRDSLGGENDGGARGKSVLIATIREDSSMVDETYSTLQFASRASKIKTVVKPATSDFLQFQSTGNMTLERAKKEISLLREHISHLEGAHLKKIEAANNPVSTANGLSNPIIVAATSVTLAERGADVTSLCGKIAKILATREAEQHDDVITTEVLQQCQIQLNELFQLCSDVATAAAANASSHRPTQTHSEPNCGYASDSSQSSLSKQRRDVTGTGVPPKPKKKTKKAAGGQTPQKPLVTPSKQKQQPEQGGVVSKVKRKASSANAALVDKSSVLTKKTSKKDKEGISLPLLKSNSAGTYGKKPTSRTVQASGNVRQVQLKEEVLRQKKVSKKKLTLDGHGGGLTTMKKLARGQKKLTNQATHNNRYHHDENEDDVLNDDLLGIINDESDGNDEGDDDDEENDDEIMRRIEMENMKIIQAEDLAIERELAREKAKNAHLKQQEAANIVRQSQSHSRSKLHSRERRQYPQDSGTGGDATPRDNSIEGILAASRNAVLAANGALDQRGSPKRHDSNHHSAVEDGATLASGRSPARQSVEEERGLDRYHPRHHHDQHQQAPPPQQQQQQFHHEQIMAPAPSQYQGASTIAAPSYNINTSYSNLNTGLMMPPSSMDNGSIGFGNKCGKHGLESCVLCTMFNAPPASVKSIQYNGTGGGAVGFPTGQNGNGPLSRSIHSPIKSADELGNSSTGKEMITPNARMTPTAVPSPLETVSGFCVIHHVNDCLLCSLTSQRRSINAPPSGYNVSSSSPSRQHATSANPTPHPNSVTVGSPGIGFTQQNNATPSHLINNTVSGLSSVGGAAAGLNSNTTAPGMFTASPNKQHNFNGYNNSVSLASKDGVYGFSKNDTSTTGLPNATNNINSSNVVASQHIPGHSVPSPSTTGPSAGTGTGSFRSRYPVKSNPISEENEQDLDGTGSNRESSSSVDFQHGHAQPHVGGMSPNRHAGTTPTGHPDNHVHFNPPSSECVGGGSSDKPRHSSAEEFEALLNSMSSHTQQKTEAIPSKYSNLPKGGGIQFEDDNDDIAPVSSRGHNVSHTRPSREDEMGGAAAAVRTDHRRGNAMNRNAQSGLYEYDYRSKVEYKDDQEENHPVQKQKPPEQHLIKPKPKPQQLSGAAASAASVYGSDMSKLVPSDGGKKAKKKQMNRKLFEMQKNKNK